MKSVHIHLEWSHLTKGIIDQLNQETKNCLPIIPQEINVSCHGDDQVNSEKIDISCHGDQVNEEQKKLSPKTLAFPIITSSEVLFL